MTLFQATLLTGLFLVAFGTHFIWRGMASEAGSKNFPRSKNAAYVLMGLASAWFLYHIWQLGPADFGQYKKIIFTIFLVAAIGSFYFVPDFLAVRGLAGLVLLSASVLLDAAYMQDPKARLFLVSFVYLAIIVAIVLGGSPYRLRDFLNWLYRHPQRPRKFGILFTAYGLLLTTIAFFY
ncbi:MAG: hypothetical protein MK088_19730 [Alteromonas sp.]|nr:hypothetical protein [Alteromonas sp.]